MLFELYLSYLIIINIITFSVYAADKRKAIRNRYRTKERSLLLLSLFGGALGGYLAMIYKHHKTNKWYFVLANIILIIVYAYLSVILYQGG